MKQDKSNQSACAGRENHGCYPHFTAEQIKTLALALLASHWCIWWLIV